MTNNELINLAKETKKNAFAEITGYKVGAVVLGKSGKVYVGANVEEKVIPAISVCAERIAIGSAYSEGERELLKIAVVGGYEEKIDETLVPCGLCCQYMLDMCKKIKVVCYINGELVEKDLEDIAKMNYTLQSKKGE